VYSDQDSDRLMIHLTSNVSSESSTTSKPQKNNFDKHFELPLIDLEADTMDIPRIEYSAELSISSPHFSAIINQLKMFGDTMEIHCSEDRILLASNSQDQGKMFVEISIDDVSAFAIDEGSNLDLSFSLGYLHNICMYNKLTKEIDLKFSDSYPMQVVYKLDAKEEDDPTAARLVFYLAPKIND